MDAPVMVNPDSRRYRRVRSEYVTTGVAVVLFLLLLACVFQ